MTDLSVYLSGCVTNCCVFVSTAVCLFSYCLLSCCPSLKTICFCMAVMSDSGFVQLLFQVFSVSVDKFEPKVIEVCDTTRHLLNQAGSGGKEFESSLAEVCDSWDSLKQSTGERQEKLDAGLAKAKHFKNMYNEMDNWLDEMEGEIDKIGKPAVQPDILQKQLETCNVCEL